MGLQIRATAGVGDCVLVFSRILIDVYQLKTVENTSGKVFVFVFYYHYQLEIFAF